MSVGGQIRKARKKAGLKQSELAEKLGLAVITIGQYERNQRQPRLEQLEAIAAALGTTVNWLLPPDNYWEGENGEGHTEPMTPVLSEDELRGQLNDSFSALNSIGQQKAVERVGELTEIPKYQRTAPQDGGESTPAPQEGTDTAPPTDAPETPPEGK